MISMISALKLKKISLTLQHNIKFVKKQLKLTRQRTPKSVRLFLFIIISLFLLFQILNIAFPLRLNINYSKIILDSDTTLLSGFLSDDDKWRMYSELYEITPELKKAIIFKEDRFFQYHPGINPISVVRAFFNNTIRHKRTSGASTITMQVARLLEPKERTYWNKFEEMFRALQLEWKFSKDEILQLYLNLVPYGSNIEGVKAASVIYFGKFPNHLSLGEIATLSIIPNRPVSLRLGKNNDQILIERNKWLKRYKSANLFDSSSIEDALNEPLKAKRRNVPRRAPHLSYRLKNTYKKQNIIYSTINSEMQQKCEAIVRTYSKGLYFQNIKNATLLVIDNKTHNVLVYIGSADFNNKEDAGQVDGIQATRSPGSTLKPLCYGLAFDKGIITPKRILTDVPTSYSGYEPENYDGKFYGYISAEDALAKSLNVPAVKILSKLGTGQFLSILSKIGFKTIDKSKQNLGLSTILGGCGTNLEELTTLYSTFANKGIYKPLNFTYNDQPKNDSIIILSEEACFLLNDILSKLKRPDLPLAWENSPNMPKIAWKTGTSYGRKDAWSIGFNKRYTIGVWVGNFSSEGVPELSGAQKASPLLFRVFNAIDAKNITTSYAMPPNLNVRYVCSHTGLIPGKHCKDLITDYFIPGISSQEECKHLKTVLINADSTVSYCLSCKPEAGYKEALYPDLEPEIIAYYENNQIKYPKIPPHNVKCERFLEGIAPKIISPVNNNEYYINTDENMQLMLLCQPDNDVKKVIWYINKKFYKKALANEKIFITPPRGNLEISCSDDKGRTSTVQIKVIYSDI